MNDSLNFDGLLASLPTGGFLGNGFEAFRVREPMPAFVTPTFRVVERTDSPSVTLISARGATGKSALARQLSSLTQVPLWALDGDLSVSADALETRLRRYMGPQNPVQHFRTSNDAFVVVDAVDEARMRVSGTSWAEFIGSIASVAGTGHHFVLLGRERILEDVWVSLSDAGIALDWFEISHFDADQRKAYVDGRLIDRGINTTNDAYLRARDAVLGALAGTVSGPLSDAFVGYAPVLDAVVALLAEGNLINVENAFSTDHRQEERVTVLVRVLVSLLQREQAKVEPLANQLGLDPHDTYAQAEQLQWLSSELLGADVPALDWCPTAKRSEYASQVEEFLRDHPFRAENRWASPVFSAYVAARHFDDSRIRGSLRSIGESTGLLFEFVSHAHAAAMINEWQFAALHASVLASEWQEVEADVSIAGDWPHDGDAPILLDSVPGELVLLAEGVIHRRAPFDLLVDRQGHLALFGPTSFLSVVFPGSVTVAPGDRSVVLGPDCFVRCFDLDIQGDSVQILRRAQNGQGAAAEGASVVLEAYGHFHDDNATLTGDPRTDDFVLRVPDELRLQYPWILYRQPVEPVEPRPNDRAVRFLKMLMTLMRRHGRKDMAVFNKKLEGRQSIKGDEFKMVLSDLAAMGVVTLGSDMIYLDESWAAQRFDGQGRPGQVCLEDRLDVWQPVLDKIALALAS